MRNLKAPCLGSCGVRAGEKLYGVLLKISSQNLITSARVRTVCWDEITAYGHPQCHSFTPCHRAGLNVFLIIKSCEFNISETIEKIMEKLKTF